MTPGRFDAYLHRLQVVLEQAGFDQARILAEAREHLADAVEDGLRRGLPLEAAEDDALARFGAPETVAAQFEAERRRYPNRWRAAGARLFSVAHRVSDPMTAESRTRLALLWHRKWWVLVPTLATAIVASLVSHYVLPTRYRSEASILIIPQNASTFSSPVAAGERLDRLERIRQVLLSQPRLERIVADLDLYEAERRSVPMHEVIRRMRDDISVTITAPETDARMLTVSFAASNPRAAMRGTERLAGMFIEENLRAAERESEGTVQAVRVQLDEVKRQIDAFESRLARAAVGSQGDLRRADAIEYDVLQETYRSLLTRSQESRIAAAIARRQTGEQWKIVEAPRLPDQPAGPRPVDLGVMGGLAGLVLGLTIVGASATRSR